MTTFNKLSFEQKTFLRMFYTANSSYLTRYQIRKHARKLERLGYLQLIYGDVNSRQICEIELTKKAVRELKNNLIYSKSSERMTSLTLC
jgi:hypothetical protein